MLASQLAYQPRPVDASIRSAYLEWIRETARLIKGLAPNHMVAVRSEGYG